MNILILHPNFPGQFKHVAQAYCNLGHTVKFLCQTHYGRKLQGVHRLTLKGRLGAEHLNKQKLSLLEKSQSMSSQYREALVDIAAGGWVPDVVISHSAWGCGMHVKEVFPKTKLITYVEWWFNPESQFFTYDESNIDLNINRSQIQKCWTRNQTISLELASADILVAPTHWQRSQLPKTFQDKCTIIFDGIDSNKFNNKKRSQKGDKIVTYGTRGMEPMRCFPQFIRSIPSVIERFPETIFEIAGEDTISYGGKPPKEGSWKKWAINYLRNKNADKNIKWLGYLSGDTYTKWLAHSSCHVYLTHPFVASWSLAEALFSGCPLVASNVKPVKEFAHGSRNVYFVDHRIDGCVGEAIKKCLTDFEPEPPESKLQARLTRLELKYCLRGWVRVLSEDLATNA